MMHRLLLCLIVLTASSSLYAQYDEKEWDKILNTYSNDQLLKESSELLTSGYFIGAERIVDKLLTKEPENNNFNYRKGFILCEGRNDYSKATAYLENGKDGVVKNYDAFSNKEKGAPEDLYFYLARSYHRMGNIQKAQENYNQFLATAVNKTDNRYFAEVALEQLDIATKLIENPKKNVEIINVGNAINTALPEYSPVVSFDGSALYFTSRRKWEKGKDGILLDPQTDFYPEDIYVSYKNSDNSWSAPTRLDFCDEDQNEASVAVSPSERRIYVYEDIIGNGNMFVSEFKNNRFGKIENYDNPSVNTEDNWETHCYITPDGRNIYFTSDRPGGYGGRDIYRIVKLPDGTWAEPFNLGPKINSKFDEDCPFMSIDNKMLYFASNGPRSMGGFDVIVTLIDEDNNWTDPINMGSPFNSFDDDLFYTETIDGHQGFLTSRRGDSYGDKDIYQVHNDYLSVKRGNYLKGQITTTTGEQIPEDITISLKCTNCDSENHNLSSYPRLRDGVYMMGLEPCKEYDVVYANKNGENVFHTKHISTSCELLYEEIIENAILDVERMIIIEPKDTIIEPVDTIPVAKPVFEPLAFKHNFSYNAAELSTSEGSLSAFIGQIEEQLKNGKEKTVISVYSSASKVPTKMFKNNKNLADARAKNIKKELDKYFASSTYKGQVEVTIISTKVDGPDYENDKDNFTKYDPFQFIELKTL